MISDTPYQIGEPVLTPRAGMAAGLVAAMGMLAFVVVLQPVSGLWLRDLLAQSGGIVLPASATLEGNISALLTGAGLHVLLGALFGLLYAACQQRVPARGLIGVGLVYGFFLWLVGSLLIGSLFGEALRAMVRGWPWLLACLLYGLCLAIAALWVESRRPAGMTIVIPD